MKMTILQNLQYTVLDLDNNNNCQSPDQWCSGKFGAGEKSTLKSPIFLHFCKLKWCHLYFFSHA